MMVGDDRMLIVMDQSRLIRADAQTETHGRDTQELYVCSESALVDNERFALVYGVPMLNRIGMSYNTGNL